MSRSVNLLFLIGNVGNDPEVRSTTGGVLIAKFSVATSWKYKGEERTDWHRCVAFGKLAEIVEQYVKKGDRVHVQGRVEYNTTKDADGNTKYFTDCIANEVVLLGPAGQREPAASAGADDGVPF